MCLEIIFQKVPKSETFIAILWDDEVGLAFHSCRSKTAGSKIYIYIYGSLSFSTPGLKTSQQEQAKRTFLCPLIIPNLLLSYSMDILLIV